MTSQLWRQPYSLRVEDLGHPQRKVRSRRYRYSAQPLRQYDAISSPRSSQHSCEQKRHITLCLSNCMKFQATPFTKYPAIYWRMMHMRSGGYRSRHRLIAGLLICRESSSTVLKRPGRCVPYIREIGRIVGTGLSDGRVIWLGSLI